MSWTCQSTNPLTCVSYAIKTSNRGFLAAFRILQYLCSGPGVTVSSPFVFNAITRNWSRHAPATIFVRAPVTVALWHPATVASPLQQTRLHFPVLYHSQPLLCQPLLSIAPAMLTRSDPLHSMAYTRSTLAPQGPPPGSRAPVPALVQPKTTARAPSHRLCPYPQQTMPSYRTSGDHLQRHPVGFRPLSS